MTREEKLHLIAKVPVWWHSMDFGDGIVTNGKKSLGQLHSELSMMQLPNLAGKSVLDIGAWDGFFSFAAEKLGARRVMALDHLVWSMELSEALRVYGGQQRTGYSQKATHLVPSVWKPHIMPGKIGFDTVHMVLNSQVEQYVADFMSVD